MGDFQDRRGGAAILFQSHHCGTREIVLKKRECRAGGAAKTVDGLVGIADGEDVLGVARQVLENLDLGEVGVLEFVDQDEAGVLAFAGQQCGVAAQQGVSVGDHVAEGAEVLFAEHALDLGEDAGDFVAAAEDFFVGQSSGFFGFGHARDG